MTTITLSWLSSADEAVARARESVDYLATRYRHLSQSYRRRRAIVVSHKLDHPKQQPPVDNGRRLYLVTKSSG